ncbi:MAG TPA: aldo/keto reductase [Pseudorhodoplanes sp.]|jgi:diketogulonate reductase-like aldo/keto reductase|nr:aldo/keto reductase [Pseudorhodoplanes sp.]
MQTVEAKGARIPLVGLGTWELRGQDCVRLVQDAARLGYRHFDTAQKYGNEAEVGEGLRQSGLRRDDYFLTTKIWPDDFRAGDFARAARESLARLKLDHVDLLLLHWPSKEVPLAETLGALVQAKKDGLTRHIGVSNFTVALLEEALAGAPDIVCNQIELHPYLDGSKITAACKKHGVAVVAYCPIARGRLTGDTVLADIGRRYGKSAAQVSLRYLVQQNYVVIPRTSKVERLKENMSIFDFALSDAEMKQIAALSKPGGRVVAVAHAPAWD